MTPQEKDRIECAIRHIQTAVDIDPWAVEIAVEAMRKELSKNSPKLDKENGDLQPTCNELATDCISRQSAIDAFMTATSDGDKAEWCKWVLEQLPSVAKDTNVPSKDTISRQAAIDALDCINGVEEVLRALPSAQPEPSEITDEQAILHLQSTGWMQNHDREMYESGLREQLADDSGSYDSLIPYEDTISRQAAIDVCDNAIDLWHGQLGEGIVIAVKKKIEELPSAQPEIEERTEEFAQNVPKEDLISRKAAIEAMSESLKRVFPEHRQIAEKCLKALPSAQPEPLWIPCSERLPEVGKDVMVCYDFKGHRSVLIGILYGDEKFHGYDDEYLTPEGRKYRKAVAWMPLPEPYRAERRTDE